MRWLLVGAGIVLFGIVIGYALGAKKVDKLQNLPPR
jgi:hypothetical protein